jgi:hypothetical protein
MGSDGDRYLEVRIPALKEVVRKRKGKAIGQ